MRRRRDASRSGCNAGHGDNGERGSDNAGRHPTGAGSGTASSAVWFTLPDGATVDARRARMRTQRPRGSTGHESASGLAARDLVRAGHQPVLIVESAQQGHPVIWHGAGTKGKARTEVRAISSGGPDVAQPEPRSRSSGAGCDRSGRSATDAMNNQRSAGSSRQ
jgi:hypothetical protein